MDVLLKSAPVFRTDGTVYLTRLNQNVQFLDRQKLVKFGTHTSSSDADVSGYVTIKDSGGTSRKLAVIS